MIEFYGEVSAPTQRLAERLRRRYFARWLLVLAALAAAVTVGTAFGGGWGWVAPLVCTALLGGVSAWLFFKAPRLRGAWLLRVRIEGESLVFTQYLGEKTRERTFRIAEAKRVYKGEYCYFIVFGDIANAVVCERRLLKKGTFAQLESLFAGKVRPL